MTEERLNEFERFALRPGESTLSHADVIDELIAEVRTLWRERKEWIRYTDDAKRACGRFNDMTGKPLPETCAEMLNEIDRLSGELAAMEKEHPCCSGAGLVAEEARARAAGERR